MNEAIKKLDGLYVGQLTEDELELLEYAVAHGKARRVYRGVMGLMGCAQVEVFS